MVSIITALTTAQITEAPTLYTFDATSVTRGELSAAAAYELTHALAAVSGIVNRDAPRFFYFWGDTAQGGVSSQTWFSHLRQPSAWLSGRPLHNCSTFEEVVSTFVADLKGVEMFMVPTGTAP